MLSRLDGYGARGAAWGADDTIVFATNAVETGLQQISAAGGEPTVLTRPNRAGGEIDLSGRVPARRPGGALYDPGHDRWARRRLLRSLTCGRGPRQSSFAAAAMRTTCGVATSSTARPARCARSLSIWPLGRSFAPPVPVVSPVLTTGQGGVDAAVADDGTLAYVSGSIAQTNGGTLVWVDRQGREEPLAAPPRTYTYPRLAPDGTRLALATADLEFGIWLWDLARATLTRVTFESRAGHLPRLDARQPAAPISARLGRGAESLRAGGRRDRRDRAADGNPRIFRI